MNNVYPWPNETSGPRKRGKISLSLSLLVAAAFWGISVFSYGQSEVSGDCYLEPYESLEISSVITGVIETVHVKEGQTVKQGEPLITLNSDVIKAQYEVAKTKAESRGRIMAAQAERDQQSHRYSLIANIGNTAEKKKEYAILQTKEGNLIAAKEDAEIHRLDAMRIRAELEERVLRSKISGVVDKVTKDEGEVVGPTRSDPNQPNYLIQILQLNTLKATAFLPYKQVKHVKVGDKLTVASADIDENWKTTGTVEFVAPGIDAATGTVRIRVVIDNYDGLYKHGAPAKVIVKVPVELSAQN